MRTVAIVLNCGHTRTWDIDVPRIRYAKKNKATCFFCGAEELISSIIDKAELV